jgi:general secretion pathway protein G
MKIHPTIVNIRRRAGFTLLEMVIVLGIIAVLMGGSIALIGKVKDGAKLQRVTADFNAISSSLEIYHNNAGFYPSSQQGLKALVSRPSGTPAPKRWTSVAKSVPLDPWGKEYGYRFPGKKDNKTFEIFTSGPDGMDNTSDDLSSQDD